MLIIRIIGIIASSFAIYYGIKSEINEDLAFMVSMLFVYISIPREMQTDDINNLERKVKILESEIKELKKK